MTRKDRLYKNVQKMQQEKGLKNFNFIPTTFLLPYEFEDFSSKRLFASDLSRERDVSVLDAFQREKGLWIIKPVASSQGKGIFLINHVRLSSPSLSLSSPPLSLARSSSIGRESRDQSLCRQSSSHRWFERIFLRQAKTDSIVI